MTECTVLWSILVGCSGCDQLPESLQDQPQAAGCKHGSLALNYKNQAREAIRCGSNKLFDLMIMTLELALLI